MSRAPVAAPVVAVDGPGGAGKGTLCALLAGRLGWHLLDSGAIYRLLGLAADRAGLGVEDAAGLARLAAGMDIAFRLEAGGEGVSALLDGEDVTLTMRTEEAGRKASLVAPLAPVRAALLERQRAFRRPPGLVADGRDMGTVVFPSAELKLFLTASVEARARRRHKQLMEKGISANLAALSAHIAERDRRDSERAEAPMRPAADAIEVDTTDLDVEAVVAVALQQLRQRALL